MKDLAQLAREAAYKAYGEGQSINGIAEAVMQVVLQKIGRSWQPIDTYYQQHRDGHSVLVAEGEIVVEAWYSNDYETWWELNSVDDGAPGSDRRVNPTHWMPLPAPPENDQPNSGGAYKTGKMPPQLLLGPGEPK